jgi:hypothetical protein
LWLPFVVTSGIFQILEPVVKVRTCSLARD